MGLQIGIVGAGGITRPHLKGFKQVAAIDRIVVADVNEAALLAARKNHDIPRRGQRSLQHLEAGRRQAPDLDPVCEPLLLGPVERQVHVVERQPLREFDRVTRIVRGGHDRGSDGPAL